MNSEKVQAIINMTPPWNQKELQKLTGRIAGLSRFISKSGDKCSAFFKTMKNAKKFEYNKDYNKTFEKLKNLLSSQQIL